MVKIKKKIENEGDGSDNIFVCTRCSMTYDRDGMADGEICLDCEEELFP